MPFIYVTRRLGAGQHVPAYRVTDSDQGVGQGVAVKRGHGGLCAQLGIDVANIRRVKHGVVAIGQRPAAG